MATIRRAKEKDLSKLVALAWRFSRESKYSERYGATFDPQITAQHFKLCIDHGIVQVAVSDEDNEIVGVLALFVANSPFHRDFKHATDLMFYVDEDERGTGTGKKLLRQAENVARQQKVNLLNMVQFKLGKPDAAAKAYEDEGYHESEVVFTKEL